MGHLFRAPGGQLIDDHRAVRSPARADQPPDVRLAGTALPHLSNHGARQDYLNRAVQRLLKAGMLAAAAEDMGRCLAVLTTSVIRQ
jgi:hypothetical protein